MNENHFKAPLPSANVNAQRSPRPLVDRLDAQSSVEKRRKHKIIQRNESTRSHNDQIDNSPGKFEVGSSTVDVSVPTIEHLHALRAAFDKVLAERMLSSNSLKQRQLVFNKLRQVILAARPGCRINLYGSMSFECCLEEPGIMDVDIQFKQTLQYDTLKELLELITKNALCKEACINIEHRPSCIDLTTNESNVKLRITSGYSRGIYLSKLIRMYTKFDPRVTKLLRLFRILVKTCNIDKPDSGTLHPLVFHVMVIHFLQQVDPPVLPCLHEYVFGIDHVPLTMNESQYSEFFLISNDYCRQWKSQNEVGVETLFLQLLSYYIRTFNAKQFVVSIQTRMPVVKIDKNWHSKRLLVEDPSDIKRSLCQTMQAARSTEYFRDTLSTALNYFGRKQKAESKACAANDDESAEIGEASTIEPQNSLHDSYKLFYKRLLSTVTRDANARQSRMRDYYKKTFDMKLPEPMVKLKSCTGEQYDDSNENEIEEAFQHDLEHNFETTDANDDEQSVVFDRMPTGNENDLDESLLNADFDELGINNHADRRQSVARQLFPSADEESKSEKINDSALSTSNNKRELTSVLQGNVIGEPPTEAKEPLSSSLNDEDKSIHVENPSWTIDENQDDSNTSPSDNNNNDLSVFTSPTEDEHPSIAESPSRAFFYDFRAENFHAEQGAPFVCTTCNDVGHSKANCPELIVPDLVELPNASEEWIGVLSALCAHIADRCKPSQVDVQNREAILRQLQQLFTKNYPDCKLNAFGSFYNGFGFQNSDLDVCIVFKDQQDENVDEVNQVMRKILKSMRSKSDLFESVQPVLHAKVPIIRSRHRQLQIEIDISFHNMLAIENTRLLKTYADIDPRVSQLGYMIKHLAKLCDIGDASRGTLSSYAYIIMVIYFLQQIKPPVLPVLQQLSDAATKKNSLYRKCSKWNVYFYEDLAKLSSLWTTENQSPVGALWIQLLRFYTEQFNHEEQVVAIRQIEPLLKCDKGWLRQTIAIEDPFELHHNLAGGLSIRNWTAIRRVFIRARQQFAIQPKDIDVLAFDLSVVESVLFSVNDLCPTNTPRRCPDCKEPWHIRKRCPKSILTVNDNEKVNRTVVPDRQQQMPRHNQQELRFNMPPNNVAFPYNVHYYCPPPRYLYQFQVAPHQRNGYPTYVNEQPQMYANVQSHFTPPQYFNATNRFYYLNDSRRKCFICGSTNHLQAQCSHLQSNARP